MRFRPKVKNAIKILHLYTKITKNTKNRNKKISKPTILSKFPCFAKKSQNITNKELYKALLFLWTKIKKNKNTKNPQNIQSFYDDLEILRSKHTQKLCAENYIVEIVDNTNLDESLFIAKKPITRLFKKLLKERQNFKYNLVVKVTMGKEIDAAGNVEFQAPYFKSKEITVINQRFYLNNAYEQIKNRIDRWESEGSGWFADRIEVINIEISNYEPLAAGSYIKSPKELSHPKKGLI